MKENKKQCPLSSCKILQYGSKLNCSFRNRQEFWTFATKQRTGPGQAGARERHTDNCRFILLQNKWRQEIINVWYKGSPVSAALCSAPGITASLGGKRITNAELKQPPKCRRSTRTTFDDWHSSYRTSFQQRRTYATHDALGSSLAQLSLAPRFMIFPASCSVFRPPCLLTSPPH